MEIPRNQHSHSRHFGHLAIWHPSCAKTLLIWSMCHVRNIVQHTRILGVAGILVVCIGLPARNVSFQTYNPPTISQTQAQEKIILKSELVVLPVTVRDHHGNLVADLLKEDFRVFDDEVEQSIDVFSSQGTPLYSVILIDADLKDDDAQQMVESLHALLGGIGVDDEALICHFDLRFFSASGFTKNTEQLFNDLEQAKQASKPGHPMFVPFQTDPSWHVLTNQEPPVAASTNLGSRPTKALDDAIYSSSQLLRDRGRERRKIILLVSDGINGPNFNTHNYKLVRPY